MTPLYPVFLRLEGRPVLVVGGGTVAAAKVQGLVEAGAKVTVVAPQVHPQLEEAHIELHRREFQADDLADAWWVVAAATAPVNRQVAALLHGSHRFLNAVDDPANASAYTGGIIRKGPVTVAVSTQGTAPALAGLLRQALETVLHDDVTRWAQVAADIRAEWKSGHVPMAERRPLLLRALNRLYAADGVTS